MVWESSGAPSGLYTASEIQISLSIFPDDTPNFLDGVTQLDDIRKLTTGRKDFARVEPCLSVSYLLEPTLANDASTGDPAYVSRRKEEGGWMQRTFSVCLYTLCDRFPPSSKEADGYLANGAPIIIVSPRVLRAYGPIFLVLTRGTVQISDPGRRAMGMRENEPKKRRQTRASLPAANPRNGGSFGSSLKFGRSPSSWSVRPKEWLG
ncbi:hypothetical protein B0H13DRAFT_1875492 [Mycena leptocephala]|nr:hypothetical protein B0H13DRAFT_1875492 [Mycena leptocephala]